MARVTIQPLRSRRPFHSLSVTATAPGQLQFPIGYQWQAHGTNLPGATASNYTFVAGAGTAGAYSVVASNAAGSTNAAWQVQVPLPGSAWAWGADGNGECDAPALTNVAGIAAGEYHSVLVRDDGTLAQWGEYSVDGSYAFPVGAPPTNANVVAVAAGSCHDLGLLAEGTVLAWGLTNAEANFVPGGLAGVTAIAAGWNHNLALLTNGTVRAWGVNGANLGGRTS